MEAIITPSVLKWARENIGYTTREIVEKLNYSHVDEQVIEDWEHGKSQPSYPQLKKLAKYYKRSIAIFFLPKPPEEESIETDFRATLPSKITQAIPPGIRYLIRKAKVRQIELAELHVGSTNRPKIYQIKTTQNDAVKLAQEIRANLNITVEKQKRFKSVERVLEEWREKVQELEVWVFKESFGRQFEEYCGFCIYDEYFPVIYLNNNQAKERQIFTIFHELAHLLTGKAGVNFRTTPRLSGTYQEKEVFCNAFAGEFLVPQSEFKDYRSLPSDDRISKIAKEYKVSYEVILRRFRSLELVNSEEYNNKIQQRSESFINRTGSSKEGGDYYLTQRVYLGKKYLEIAFSQYYNQRIDRYQLADYLGVKISNIAGIEDLL